MRLGWAFTIVLIMVEFAAGQKPDWSAFPRDGETPENCAHVHDPTILHLGDRYFCFSTSGNGFGVLRSSPDLHDWTVHGAILRSAPDWLRQRIPHRSIWAPDVLKVGERVRLYYCASETFGRNTSVIGVAECEKFDPQSPHDGWRDLGLIIESNQGKDHYNAIDPETIISEDGRHWLYFGSYFSGLYVVELDPQTGKLLKPDAPELIPVAKNTADRGNPLEAPAVLFRDGYYYLFVSYGLAAQGVRSTYHIVVGRSKSASGPFVDREGKPMIEGGHVVVLKSSPPMFGPGHCDVFKDASGRWLLTYHFYDARHFWTGDKWGLPTLQVRELIWSDDGWPLPGMPLDPKREKSAGATTRPAIDLAGRWLHQVDFTEPSVLELHPDGTASHGRSAGNWSLQGRSLTLTWPRADAPGEKWIDALILADDGGYYVGRNQRGVVIRGSRETATP